MRILIAGATGFIGSQVCASLINAGHEIVAAVRSKPKNPERFVDIVYCDFNKDTNPEVWLPRLENIEVVINCVGILQESGGESIANVHTHTPIALFEACQQRKIKRLIHLSALGADDNAPTAYAQSKKAAEDHLKQMKIDWVILRPSLVYASGSYGGTSLMRGVAALPGFIPVLKNTDPCFMPIHLEDLAKAIVALVKRPRKIRETFDAVSSQAVPYSNILLTFRRWLGFGKARLIHVPVAMMRFASFLGDKLKIGPLNSTALNMLLYGNQTTAEKAQRFAEVIKFTPREFTLTMQSQPSYVQDRWHARLFFLRPLLRIVVSLFWLGSGLSVLYAAQTSTTSNSIATVFLSSIAGCEIILGLLSLCNWRTRLIGLLQLLFLLIYTIAASIITPALWLDPLAPLFKNLVLLLATLIMVATAEER